jgi:hypothetical protein
MKHRKVSRYQSRLRGVTFAMFLRAKSGLPDIVEFMNAWLLAKDKFAAWEFATFEEMVSDPVEHVGRLVDFCGVPEWRKYLPEAAKIFTFDNMRQHDKLHSVPTMIKKWGGTKKSEGVLHMRSGPGGYRKFMSEADLEWANQYLQKHLDPFYKWL